MSPQGQFVSIYIRLTECLHGSKAMQVLVDCQTQIISIVFFLFQVRPIIGAIGGTAGVILVLALIIAFVIVWKSRRRDYDLLNT